MQVGSLVECIEHINIGWKYQTPVIGGIYTVTGFVEKPRGLGVYLMEFEHLLINVGYPNGKTKKEQMPWNKKHFRELLPPIKIEVPEFEYAKL